MQSPARYIVNRTIAHYAGQIPVEVGNPHESHPEPYAVKNKLALVARNPSHNHLGDFAVNLTLTGSLYASPPEVYYAKYDQVSDVGTVHSFEGSTKKLTILDLFKVAVNLRQIAKST